MHDLSVVIVTYRSHAVLGRALASIPRDCEVIIVDNASEENPNRVIGDRPVLLFRNRRNAGYGAACNRGVAAAQNPYVLVMNPDVRLRPDTIQALRAAIAANPDCDFFSPTIVDENGRQGVRTANAIETWAAKRLGRVAPDVPPGETRFLHGAAFLVRRQAFLDLGGFDERIFLYYEDDDLSFRIVQSGRGILKVPEAVVDHETGSSCDKGLGSLFRRGRHKKRSEIYVTGKWNLGYSPAADTLNHLGKIVFYAVTLNGSRLSSALGRLSGILDRPPSRGRRRHVLSRPL